MNAVATHTTKPHFTDSSEIAKMVLIGVTTLVLMTLTILSSDPSRADISADTTAFSAQWMNDKVMPVSH